METLVVLSLFLAGCWAQGGIQTPGVGSGPFQPFGTPGASTFQSGTGVQFSQPGVNTQFTQPGVATGFQPGVGTGAGVGVGTQFQPGLSGTPGFVGTGFQPGMTQPGVGTLQPGMVQPGVGPFQPGMTQPGMGTLQPGMVQPGVGTLQPGMTQPGVGTLQPGMIQPGVGTMQPGMGPGMGPGMVQPGVGTMQPGMTQPGVGTLQPGMTQPGMVGTSLQPGMTTGPGSINPALQTQFLTQTGQTASGFGTMGPFSGGSMPAGTTGFVGSEFLGPPGLSGPPMQVPLSPIAALMMSLARNPNNYRYATCMLNDTSSTVKGRIDFRQFMIGEGRQQVNVRIQLAGLPQSTINVGRGIHIHEFGDTGDMCSRVGPHFNPHQTPHGSRRNFAFLRHVGDLGNLIQSPQGIASTQFSDQVISLEGIHSIIGRSFVVTQERDDEGFGGNVESTINGNALTPLACCPISRTTSRNWFRPLTANDLQNMAMTQILPDETFPQFNAGTNFNIVNGGMVNQVNPNAAFPSAQSGFGQVAFSPTNTNGQSFVFNTQGKKK